MDWSRLRPRQHVPAAVLGIVTVSLGVLIAFGVTGLAMTIAVAVIGPVWWVLSLGGAGFLACVAIQLACADRAVKWRTRAVEADFSLCERCGHALRGLGPEPICPECGHTACLADTRERWRR
ncbi:MAG: hypothetical protein JNK35_12055 [Phycisphaerae bacterium]|nr:hypothetical protein [Phycisphaerae bacterium]